MSTTDFREAHPGSEMIHSATCQRCGNVLLGPVAGIDDIKWSLGHWILSMGREPSLEEYRQMWNSAQDAIQISALNLEMREIFDRCDRVGHYGEMDRAGIKRVLEKYEEVCSGSIKMMDSRNAAIVNQDVQDEPEPLLAEAEQQFPPVIFLNQDQEEQKP